MAYETLVGARALGAKVGERLSGCSKNSAGVDFDLTDVQNRRTCYLNCHACIMSLSLALLGIAADVCTCPEKGEVCPNCLSLTPRGLRVASG